MDNGDEKMPEHPYGERYAPGIYKPGPLAFDVTSDKSGELLKEVIKPGNCNCSPTKGCKVSVHYKAYLKDGSIFEDSKENGEPCEFILGEGKTIKALDMGVATMNIGEISVFSCKFSYCFQSMTGKKKNKSAIKRPAANPQEMLFFEVELLKWDGEDLSPKRDGSLLRKTIIEGEEEEDYPVKGYLLCIKIACKFKGKLVYEKKVGFFLGNGAKEEIPSGVEIALENFKIGETAHLTVAPKYGYGTEGSSKYGIPPNSVVDFIVTLIRFEKTKKVGEINPMEMNLTAIRLKERGTYFFKKGNYLEALKFYKQMMAVVLQNCGSFYKLQDSSQPFELFHSADSEGTIELRKSLLLAGHLNIAACYLKLKDYDSARIECNRALHLDSENEKALFRRGQAYLAMELYREAKIDFERVLNINPSNKVANENLLSCIKKINDCETVDDMLFRDLLINDRRRFLPEDVQRNMFEMMMRSQFNNLFKHN
ncbi:FK506-binding protein 59-like [Lycorma delicatula]|uniref:FK506-binding protein 59-like n=1 Tax=Lycorma delicatula TaxID=130591 RepID=UPI003F50F4C3